MSLTGKRILVARPQMETSMGGDRLVQMLTDAGAIPYHRPVMAINPITEGEEAERAKTAIMDLDLFSTVIFVSRPAARLGLELIDRFWPQLPINSKFYAVGKSTAYILSEYPSHENPMMVQTPDSQYTSEGLLQLNALQNLSHQKVLIVRGAGGRELLADQLQQRGAEVTYAELYRREPTKQHQAEICQLLQQGMDGIVVHSGEILAALLMQLKGASPELSLKLKNTSLLAPSARVARLADNAGFQQVITASSALPEAMVSALSEWYISGNH